MICAFAVFICCFPALICIIEACASCSVIAPACNAWLICCSFFSNCCSCSFILASCVSSWLLFVLIVCFCVFNCFLALLICLIPDWYCAFAVWICDFALASFFLLCSNSDLESLIFCLESFSSLSALSSLFKTFLRSFLNVFSFLEILSEASFQTELKRFLFSSLEMSFSWSSNSFTLSL